MARPANTKNFNALTGAISTVAPINTALSQISYAITQLQTIGANGGLVTITVTAGEALTANDAAYLNPADNKMYAIDANAAPALSGTVRGFVETTVAGAALGSLVIGGILGGFSSLTAWLPVYADITGAGTVTQTRPYPLLDSGQMAIVPLGMAISATQIAVMSEFMDCQIRYQARYSPALDETITIEHGQNPNGLARQIAAYVSQGSIITEYASSNQDANSHLQGIVAAGGTIDTNGTGSTAALGDSGGTEIWQAQSFVATEGLLAQITIAFGANTGSPSGDMTWKIVADNGGQPTGAVLTSGTHTIVPSSGNAISISSLDDIHLDGTSTYWLRLEVPAQATNARWNVVCSTSSSYANGQRSASTNGGSSWSAVSTSDMDVVIETSQVISNDKLAQGFQVSSGSTVERVRLWLAKVGSPTGNLTVKIQTNNAGNPSGTPVTNGTSNTVAASSLSTSYGYIDFTFSTPPSISAATQYHIVLETTDSQSDTNFVMWGADFTAPITYSSGVMKRERSSVWSNEGKLAGADAVFQVIITNIQYINPVKVGWWGSTQADMVNQFGDSGGADVDTKTTFKCKLSAGFEDITVEATL